MTGSARTAQTAGDPPLSPSARAATSTLLARTTLSARSTLAAALVFATASLRLSLVPMAL